MFSSLVKPVLEITLNTKDERSSNWKVTVKTKYYSHSRGTRSFASIIISFVVFNRPIDMSTAV